MNNANEHEALFKRGKGNLHDKRKKYRKAIQKLVWAEVLATLGTSDDDDDDEETGVLGNHWRTYARNAMVCLTYNGDAFCGHLVGRVLFKVSVHCINRISTFSLFMFTAAHLSRERRGKVSG